MSKPGIDLRNLDACFPSGYTPEQAARARTLFFQRLALAAHRFYGGKIQVLPKAPVPGPGWLGAWYTPGVSAVSTAIRDDQAASFELSGRGNLVAVVSDGTRVLGDGDVTPSGALGVMEGKAFLMKYLGGIDAVPLCLDSRDRSGRNDPEAIIDVVRRCQHSFGAINLEDISQPNCYRVLDELREACDIPVWHDDAQGTACVTLAGLLGALAVAGKELGEATIVFLGAGAANTATARLVMSCGADPGRIVMADVKGTLGRHRDDIKADPRFYPQWAMCQQTNPGGVKTAEAALRGADVLIALSAPGPGTVRPEWIGAMAPKAIVFACANPVPEIYPDAAKAAGAFIAATGRGDFPNQVNNSLGFPGILKGALLVRARKISDGMAIAAARSLADYAAKHGRGPEYIIPSMDEVEVFPHEAATVAAQAAAEGVARAPLSMAEVYQRTLRDITAARNLVEMMAAEGYIPAPPQRMLDEALAWAIERVG